MTVGPSGYLAPGPETLPEPELRLPELAPELQEAIVTAFNCAQGLVDEIGDRERLIFTLAHFGVRNIPGLREKMYMVFRSDTDMTDLEQRYRSHYAVVTGFTEAPRSLSVSTMDLGEEMDIKLDADRGHSLLIGSGETVSLPPPDKCGPIMVDHNALLDAGGYLVSSRNQQS